MIGEGIKDAAVWFSGLTVGLSGCLCNKRLYQIARVVMARDRYVL